MEFLGLANPQTTNQYWPSGACDCAKRGQKNNGRERKRVHRFFSNVVCEIWTNKKEVFGMAKCSQNFVRRWWFPQDRPKPKSGQAFSWICLNPKTLWNWWRFCWSSLSTKRCWMTPTLLLKAAKQPPPLWQRKEQKENTKAGWKKEKGTKQCQGKVTKTTHDAIVKIK